MEHIQEIRSLRQRLEESIKTNEKLRSQLERHGLEFDQGKKDLPRAGTVCACSLAWIAFCTGKSIGLVAREVSVQTLTLLLTSRVPSLSLAGFQF